ncbi:MAG: hypothetical protein NTNFB02_00320 [Nitrospira sp.]
MKTEQPVSHHSSVLIVEDEPDLSLALEDYLHHEGYTVRCASTGRQALQEAEDHSFGAVLLDLGLPDLSGFAVLRGLEELDPLLPVIVLTASVQRIRPRRVHGRIPPPWCLCLYHQALQPG